MECFNLPLLKALVLNDRNWLTDSVNGPHKGIGFFIGIRNDKGFPVFWPLHILPHHGIVMVLKTGRDSFASSNNVFCLSSY